MKRQAPPLYRFFKEEKWARALVDEGSLLLRPFSYYRQCEDADRSGRADPDEGLATFFDADQVYVVPRDGNIDPFHRRFINAGPNAGSIVFADGWFESQQASPEAYIYCLSDTYSEEMKARMGQWCVRIAHLDEFMRAILKTGFGRGKWRYKGNPVSYALRGCDYREVLPQEPAFIKPPDLDWQREWRMMWQPLDGTAVRDELQVCSERIARCCELYSPAKFTA